jgi:excisionase family DNA binding protein
MSRPRASRATTERPLPSSASSVGWLSLGPASRLVGVDPDTLRRWADAGRLTAYTTPGGHRRFDRRDLDRVVLAGRRGAHLRPLAALGATPDRLSRAYARSYRARDDRRVVGERFDADERAAFRADGRRLLVALLGYLDATSASARARWEGQAGEAVRATGARLAASGADAREAITTFIAARRPFLGELASLGRRRALDPVALAALYDEAVALLDRLLIELLDAVGPAPIRPAPGGVSR